MKRYRWLVQHPAPVILTVALLLRLAPLMVRFVIGSDEALFLTLGQNLAAGRGYTGDGVTLQIDFPPGYPLFAAAVYSLGFGPEWPTILNVLLIGSLVPLTIYWLARQLTDAKTGLLAGLLTAVHPALVLGQGNFESVAEQPYSLLLYTGWGLLWWGYTHRRAWAFGLAGMLVGLAHLVRWEGIIMGLFAAGIILVMLRRDRLLPQAISLYMIGLMVFAIPFALFLHRHTGTVLSPKTMLTQLHAAAIDATADDPWAFERDFYQHYNTWLADPSQPPPVVQDARGAVIQRYLGNLAYEIRLWFTAISFLTLLWISPFFIGLIKLFPWRSLFLLPLFTPLGFIPASVVDPRYFLIPLPVAMIFTACGLIWLAVKLPVLRLSGYRVPSGNLLVAGVLIIFMLTSLTGPLLYPRPTGYRAAGLALRGQIPAGSHMLARKRQLPFYANGVWHWLPFASFDEVLAQAQAQNIQYLVVDTYTTPSLRPQLAFLLDADQAPEKLRPVYQSEDVVVYEIGGQQ